MSMTVDTGYVLISNNQTTTIDLRGYTNLESARIRWKGRQSRQDGNIPASCINIGNTPFNIDLLHPTVPAGCIFDSAVVTTEAHNSSGSTISLLVAAVVSGSASSSDSEADVPNLGRIITTTSDFSPTTQYSNHSVSSDISAYVAMVSSVTVFYHRFLQSTDAQTRINGEITKHSGSIYDGNNSEWVTLKGLQIGALNTITHNVSDSYYVEVEIEYIVSMKAAVATQDATNISYTSATLQGIVTSTGGSAVTVYIEWGLSPEYGNIINKGSPTVNVPFTYNLTDIDYGTIIYYRAYATNDNGTSYGEQGMFTTLYPTLASPNKTAPANKSDVANRYPYFQFTLTENVNNDASKYHARIKISEYVDLSASIADYESKDDQSNWELWNGSSWVAFPEEGVNPGSIVRVMPTSQLPLRKLYWASDSFDGTRYSDNSTPWSLRVVLTTNGIYALAINDVSYNAYNLKIVETANGQIGQITCTINNDSGDNNATIDYGHTVQVAVNDNLGASEEFVGIVKTKSSQNYALTIGATTGSGILSERLIAEDYSSQDIGISVKAIIDDYCTPITSDNININTGIVAPITCKDKTPLSIFEDLRRQYGVMYFIDATWDMYFYLQSEISSPYLIVQNGGNA